MNIFLKTEDEIEMMRKANLLVSRTLVEVGSRIKPGVTTLQLDKVADEFIRDNGAIPSFKGCPNPLGKPFPSSICTSVNAIVVHGIPNAKCILKEGDIVSVDCGVVLDGFNGDSCYTFCVGEVKPEIKRLLRTTKEALYKGIEQVQSGHHIGDIGHAIQSYSEGRGYGVVRELSGHGIGRSMHEDPPVFNYGKAGDGVMLKAGMCLSIEPMITMGDRKVWMLHDKWQIITRDMKPAAHYEHTVAVRDGKADILSSFDEIESLKGQNI